MLLAGPSQAFHQYISNATASSSGGSSSNNAISEKSSLGSSRDDRSASIITISSTSSASSSSNSRFSLIKSMVSRGTELFKQTVQNSLLSKLTPGTSKAKNTTDNLTPTSSSSSCSQEHAQLQLQQQRPDSKCSEHSTDSLQTEMCHFKPINSVPKTPVRTDNEVIKIRSVRPESSRSDMCFTPAPSPFKPNDPTTPRRSAFSVVSFVAYSINDSPSPPSLSPLAEELLRTPVKLKSPPKPKRIIRGGRKRKPSVSPPMQQDVEEESSPPPQKAAPKSRKLNGKPNCRQTKNKNLESTAKVVRQQKEKQPETVSKAYSLRRTAVISDEVKMVKVVEKSVAIVQNVRRSTRKKA